MPDTDPDGPEVPIPESISIPQALSAVSTLRTFAEQQKGGPYYLPSAAKGIGEGDEGFAGGK